ncbi:helix-turn-helix transcriptional regulator [Nonomuraea wenchangensis]
MNGSDEHALGTLVRHWRERALLTQEQLAEKAGLSARTIRRLELGDPHRPRTASLRLLSEALGLNAAERALLTATRPLPPLPLAVRDAAARLRSAWDVGHERGRGDGRCPGPFGRSPENAAP